MPLLALLLTAALCALFALLPARLGRRAPSPADAKAGAGTFAFVWAAALFIYSKPSLTAGFDAFRLAALCALAVWAGGCVCWLRLCKKGGIAMAGLLLAAAVGAEALLFNAPYFATHALQPVQLFDYLADSVPREADGTVVLQEGQDTLQFEGLNFSVYSLRLDGLRYLRDGSDPPRKDPLLPLTVSVTCRGMSSGGEIGQWTAAVLAPRSLERFLDLNVPVQDLTLRGQAYTGEYRHSHLAYRLSGVTANAPRAFAFSAPRCLIVYLLLLAGWLLRPGSLLWQKKYLADAKYRRPATVLCAVVLMVPAAAAPFANPLDSGIATAVYNVSSWDGSRPLTFPKHLDETAHDDEAQYGALASSLLKGRLDLMLDPPDALAEMDDPYDTTARFRQAPDALWDVAYYNGRYYVYFGIVPCLLFQLPFEALTGIPDLPPAPCMAVLACVFIAAAFALAGQAVRRWFPQATIAACLLCAAGLVVGGPLYYLLLRPAVYEYAILCGAVFLLLALWLWLAAANTPVERRGALLARLALGSLCMALAAGCRPQMELLAVLCLPIFWQRYIREKRLLTRAGAVEAAAFVLPVLLVAVGLMWYNAARFGSPFDFGANYNLTSNDMNVRGFNVGRIGPALFTFFFAPPAWQAAFPYLGGSRMQTNYLGLTITELFYGGILTAVPFTWGLAMLPWLRRRLKSKPGLTALVWLCLGGALVLALLDCEMAGVLYRYLMDFAPALLLAAAFAWLGAEEALSQRPAAAKLLRSALALSAAGSAVYAFCLFFAAEPWLYGQSPALYQTVSRLVQFWL